MFQGRSALTLDGKGRLSVPVKVRDLLIDRELCVDSGRALVTITRFRDKCLLIYRQDVWLQKRAAVDKLPEKLRKYRRLFIGSATTVELDAANRVLISPELREAVGLVKDVVLIGLGDQLELWDAATLKEKEAKDLEEMADEEQDLDFSI